MLRRHPGTWRFKFPKVSFKVTIKNRRIRINKKPIKLQPSKNKKFPGWWTFPFRRVNYFIRFTTKGVKLVSVKGKKPIITKIVKRKPGTKPKKGGKKPTKEERKPKTGEKKPSKGKKPKPGKKPATGKATPTTGKKNPKTGKKTPKRGKKQPKKGKKHPNKGKKHPKKGEKRPITTRPGKPGKRKQLTVKIAFPNTIMSLINIQFTIKQALKMMCWLP